MADLNRVHLIASAFVRRFGGDCGARLPEIAPAIGLKIREVDGVSFDGALVRVEGANRGRVALRRGIREEGRRRFTLGHEFAHYLLPEHGTDMTCGSAEIESWDPHLAKREREANAFAAEILMPRDAVFALVAGEPSFRSIEIISRQFGTSLTAAAVRFVEVTSHRVAIVWSEAGRARWYWSSSEFGRGVRLGPLSEETVAFRCFSGTPPPQDFVGMPAIAWLYEANLREDSRIFEWSVYFPHYNAALALLHIADVIEAHHDYEDPDDEELDPREFTLDRRRWFPER